LPIAEGAVRLAARVRQYPFRPGDQIVFLAHSMGGLVVRKMLADNLLGVLTSSYPVAGFITLGTPHLGYPYLPVDGWTSVTGKCSIQVEQMQSYLDPRQC
jgi:triacylglycerol esterase/lipase EstA (alpha/beta hydrolase family)